MVMQIWQAILEWSVDKKRALSMLWGSHLRFFRQLVSRASCFARPLCSCFSNTSTHLCPVLPHHTLQYFHLVCKGSLST